MLIDGRNVDEIKEHLSKNYQMGNKWVAFNPYRANLKTDIHCFRKQPAVAEYCSIQQNLFKPISNVFKTLHDEGHEHFKAVDPHVLNSEILKLPIEPFRKHEEIRAGLVNGELYPVLLKRQINADEISSYKIFDHRHPGHQVYEIGHELDLAASFSTYKEASEFFEQHLNNCSVLGDHAKPDLTLLAEFKHQKPELDIEGFPMYNSAFLLKVAYPNYDLDQRKKIYEVKDWQDINSLEIKQPVLAKFNKSNNQLELFNGNLEKVQPTEKVPYMSLSHFSTSKVEIINAQKQTINKEQNNNDVSQKIKIS